MTRIAVLKGGRSLERQVSLKSAARVEDALARLGYEVVGVDVYDEVSIPHVSLRIAPFVGEVVAIAQEQARPRPESSPLLAHDADVVGKCPAAGGAGPGSPGRAANRACGSRGTG